MQKVALTGGIGSGKTTIARILSGLGIPVFNADKEARNLMESSDEIIGLLKKSFGGQTYVGESLNRKFLAEIVFSDPDKLSKLNQIVHPAVHRYFESWCENYREFPYVVEEAAIIFESGGYKFFDKIILVIAPIEQRIQRVMNRDQVEREQVLNRITSQISDEEKIPLSDFLIFNDDNTLVINQVLALHEKLISLTKN